jgi:hypothetical protein
VSRNPGPHQTLELLERLRGVVRDFKARADKLNEEFHGRMAKERLWRESILGEHQAETAAAVNEAEVAFLDAKATAEVKHERRKSRISRAYSSSRDQALKDIENQTGGQKYEMQKRSLQAERDREAALAVAAKMLQEFKANLAVEHEALAALEANVSRAFGGYSRFRKLLEAAYEKAQPELSRDENQMLAELRELMAKTRGDLERFGHVLLRRLFKHLPIWIVIAVGEIPIVLWRYGLGILGDRVAGGAVAGTIVVILGLRHLAQRQAEPLAATIASGIARARRLHDDALTRSDTHYQEEIHRIQDEHKNTTQSIDQQLKRALAQAGELRVSCRMQSDGKAVRVTETNEKIYRQKTERIEREHTAALEQVHRAAEVRLKALTQAGDERENKLNGDYRADWRILEAEWKSQTEPLYAAIEETNALAAKLFPPWDAPWWKSWTPPEQFAAAAKFGELKVEVEKLAGGLPNDKRLALPGPASFPLALSLGYPDHGSIVFETGATGHDEAVASLNTIILRLLAVAPPGRLKFTIIDPVGLGQNFAGVMHLADYEEQIINSRIWTQSGQIEQRLADLNEHMEKVIQMYLRNEYATIAEYNEQAGVIAEKYLFLVVADFPVNFTETAVKRLASIAASGARCGVYMLLHWDQRQPVPQEFMPDELRKNSFCISCKGKEFMALGKPSPLPATGGRQKEEAKPIPGAQLQLDAPPTPELATEFIHEVGQKSRDSSRVEVPFEHVAPPDAKIWSEETTNELRVPVGRTGATKFQYLAIGKGTRQHGLIAGKTGSGKSTLFHVIITNLSLWCSPEQVEFYLVDFKKGVEFKCYAANRLPHARVVAIESDREFGLSVLQRIDEELKHRGDLFRELGVQDVPGYKRAGGTESIPRSLLLIDEFQEFFVEDDKIAQTASLLLDRIVRQGRAFGIHVLLGSQTLGGAYTVARTTLGQMVIRIALQCNEADSYLIMDENNPAPRLLSRPGEGIYNDTAGTMEGNSPFQVVWLPDEVREAYLKKVRARADEAGAAYPGPIVFEGNAPADIRENALLQGLLTAESVKPTLAPRIWLGAPNSIKGPTEAVFHRQSGNNLLLVGQREEAMLAILSIGLVSLAAQFPVGGVRIILCDSTAPGSAQRTYLERIIQAIPHPITLVKQGDLGEMMGDLAAEMKKRGEQADAESAPPIFLFIHGLHKFGKLRHEEDFGFSAGDAEAPPNPAVVLNNLLCEGTRLGFHVIASCDTYNNVNRFLSRKAFSEFEMRVLFQMSANDSASLIDNPKAGALGLHRALFYNEQEGHLETFRPYALPGKDWIEMVGERLKRGA